MRTSSPAALARPLAVAARRPLALLAALAVVATGLLGGAAVPASAATPTTYGYDISWPQCPVGTGTDVGGGYGIGYGNPMPPTTASYVVVGLTAGLPFTRNPCLADQIAFTQRNGIPRGVYTMTAYPTAQQVAAHGGTGPRTGTAETDRLFNTGYAMARHDLASMRAVGVTVPFLWIDVESRRVQNWPKAVTSTGAVDAAVVRRNRAVLEGVAQGFRDAGLAVGWYSVASAWRDITANWQNRDPLWKAGGYTGTGFEGARSICSTNAFNGGQIWMGQRLHENMDLNATCPPLPSLATIFAGAVRPSVSALTASTPAAAAGATVTYGATLGTTQPWAASLVNACTSTAVRTWSGTASGALRIAWDGTDAAGGAVPAGLYRFSLTSAGVTRTALTERTAAGTAVLDGCGVSRTAGADRYATSVALGRAAAPTSRVLVVASGAQANLVDGLVAAPLARAVGAPLLLTAPDGLPAAVLADVRARRATTAYVVGGRGAVSDAVVAQLRADGVAVTRLSGADRYATSVAVAREVTRRAGSGATVWVAAGTTGSLVDALAAGGGAAVGEPILLTSRAALPAVVAAELDRMGARSSYVVGGEGVVSRQVLAALPAPTRLSGADRYATAVAVARHAGTTAEVVVSSGADANLVDALPAGALGRPLVLTAPAALPAATSAYLVATKPASVRVAGGTGAVAPQVLEAVAVATR